MDRKTTIMSLSVLISIAALTVGVTAHLKPPSKEVELTPPPDVTEEPSGPIYTGSGAGYIIEFENGVKFYFAGDTALFAGMKFVIGDYYKPEVAFLPIGDIFTMGPKEAAYATTFVNPKYAIPYHYHTFPMLTQTADGFVNEVNAYRSENLTKAQAIVLEFGVTSEIEGVKVTWLGHSTMLMESLNGTKILIDPWLEANPDCPTQYKNITTFGDIDLILLTHGHLDHVTPEELDTILKMYSPVIIAQFELALYLQDRISMPIAWINTGGSLTKDTILAQGIVPPEVVNTANIENIRITMVEAVHTSSPP